MYAQKSIDDFIHVMGRVISLIYEVVHRRCTASYNLKVRRRVFK